MQFRIEARWGTHRNRRGRIVVAPVYLVDNVAIGITVNQVKIAVKDKAPSIPNWAFRAACRSAKDYGKPVLIVGDDNGRWNVKREC